MTSDDDLWPTPADKSPLLGKALEKNQDVKDKMEDCATELATVNDTVKEKMAAGSTLQEVEKTLARSENVEDKVQECADELHEVNEVLVQEIDDRKKLSSELKETGQTLSDTQNILSDTQDVLAVAHRVAEETSALLVHSEGIQTELRRDIMEGQRIEKALFEEKERLRVTLAFRNVTTQLCLYSLGMD